MASAGAAVTELRQKADEDFGATILEIGATKMRRSCMMLRDRVRTDSAELGAGKLEPPTVGRRFQVRDVQGGICRRRCQGMARRRTGAISLAGPVAQESKWVKTGVTGRLIYVPDAQGDRIPDFSMVGYGAGKKAIPDNIPVRHRHIDPDRRRQHVNISRTRSTSCSRSRCRPTAFAAPSSSGREVQRQRPFQHHRQRRDSARLGPRRQPGDQHAHRVAEPGRVRLNVDPITMLPVTQVSASTAVINIAGSSSANTLGSQIQIIDKVVPVGAQSFRVASTSGMAVGGMVEIFRPSTRHGLRLWRWTRCPRVRNWANSEPPVAPHDHANRRQPGVLRRADYDGARPTIWRRDDSHFSAPNAFKNVGVENLWGQSLDTREEAERDSHTHRLVSFSSVDDGFARDLETRHFPYVCGLYVRNRRHAAHHGRQREQPPAVGRGDRRPALHVCHGWADDARAKLDADDGRHDFVTGSAVTGPDRLLQLDDDQLERRLRPPSSLGHRPVVRQRHDRRRRNQRAKPLDERQRARLGGRQRGGVEFQGQQLHHAKPADGAKLARGLDRHDQRGQLTT